MLKKITDYLILGFSVLLVFLLVFENFISIPRFLGFTGRFHPVILHFPIVLLILSVINSFTSKKPYQDILLPATILITLLTALTGFFLKMESDSAGNILTWHQWLGGSVALLAVFWYGLENMQIPQSWLKTTFRISIVVMIVLTGHFGGMVTHGQDFLSWPGEKQELMTEIPDDPLIFEHIIQPILQRKCVSCHNPDKTKGGLLLTEYTSLLAGGDTRRGIVPGEPDKSEIISRISLPQEHEDHMPPPEKEQLTQEEQLIINEWVRLNAGTELKLSMIEKGEPLLGVLDGYLKSSTKKSYDQLPKISDTQIRDLSSDYCTIRRIAEGSKALSIVVFPSTDYEKKRLKHLKPIRENIVELDLSRLPVGDEEILFISECQSLEKLEINETPVDDEGIDHLADLKNLRVLKAGGTLLTDDAADVLEKMISLEDLFIRGTRISDPAIEKIRKSNPGLNINTGIDPEISFTSILPAPGIEPDITFFNDPVEISFTHPLEEINIFYTLDGSDSINKGQKYRDKIPLEESMIIKFQASREGWTSSIPDSVRFFRTLQGPDEMKLLFPPDEKYTGRGVGTAFDLEKGTFNLRDSSWLGFQNDIFELHCFWENPVDLNEIILSSFVNTGIHVFPPERIRIHGGNSDEDMKVLFDKKYAVLDKERGASFNYINCPVESGSYHQLIIKVIPLKRLPAWHPEKGKPGWFFVDEVVLGR